MIKIKTSQPNEAWESHRGYDLIEVYPGSQALKFDSGASGVIARGRINFQESMTYREFYTKALLATHAQLVARYPATAIAGEIYDTGAEALAETASRCATVLALEWENHMLALNRDDDHPNHTGPPSTIGLDKHWAAGTYPWDKTSRPAS